MKSPAPAAEAAVVDASALVDLFVAPALGQAVKSAMAKYSSIHAPAHVDAEVLSALGRLHRAGALTAREVASHLGQLATAPIERHDLPPLLAGAWRRRDRMRLQDALYVELSEATDATLLTTDAKLALAAGVEPVIP